MWYYFSYAKYHRKLLVLNGVRNRRKLFNRPRLPCRLLYHLAHMIHHTWHLRYQWQVRTLFGTFGRPVRAYNSRGLWNLGART